MKAPAASRPAVPRPRPSRAGSASQATLRRIRSGASSARGVRASAQRATYTSVWRTPGAKARFDENANHFPSGEKSGKDRKSTRLNSSHDQISYAVFCLKKKKKLSTSTHTEWHVRLNRM